MKMRGLSTVRNLTVRISGMRMASYILSPHQKTRSTSEESTSGLSGKLRVNRVVNEPNPTGKHTTDLVTYSKPKSKNQTKNSFDVK